MYACAKEDYEPHPTCFTLRIHHGGCLNFYPGRAYCGGKRIIVDMGDIKTFTIHELNLMVLDLCYTVKEIMFYNFKVPGKNLDIWLQALSCDDDVLLLRVTIRLFLDMVAHEETQVVEDSRMLEGIYDDVASTNRMDDDSYCHTPSRQNHEKIRAQEVLDLEDMRRENRGKKEWKEVKNTRAKEKSL
uniref:EF-hand domain pair, mitogen-activated protein (MAP) kinase n=1 Tax=Tanacetum cinerariifolium TaxID=118510 RepID=A0A6L2L0U3_TANCI|nr:EF-hand domain pair, mitogen-activated protein (MAP) kinase [Tanacetum cinerariifolium]